MKTSRLFTVISAAVLSVAIFACQPEDKPNHGKQDKPEEEKPEEPTGDDPENSVFKLAGMLPSEVNVTIDDLPLYKYEFGYDTYKRLSTFKLTGNGNVLQNVTITQNDAVRQQIKGKYSNSQFDVSISVRWASGSLVWAYEGVQNPNRYVVNCGEDNLPKKFYYNLSYTGNKYVNNTTYNELFTSDGKNLIAESYQSVMQSTGKKGLKCAAGPVSKMKISYTDSEDTANIGSFFLGEEFVVWYTKGLPGNKNLISKIEYTCDDTKLARSDEFSYDIDASSKQVRSVTVKQYYNTTLEHTYVYSFKY